MPEHILLTPTVNKEGKTESIKIALPHGEGKLTPEGAVELAAELISAAGLPYTIISLIAKRDDLLVRTPVENTTSLKE